MSLQAGCAGLLYKQKNYFDLFRKDIQGVQTGMLLVHRKVGRVL